MDDRLAQFLILIGDLCRDAAEGELTVTFELDDGTQHTGVPTVPIADDAAEEVNDTGLADTVSVDDSRFGLLEIRRCTVTAPR